MKWKEFEAKYSKELYEELRRMREEIHARKQSRFCNYCYKREGWRCFPCSDMKALYQKRHGQPLKLAE